MGAAVVETRMSDQTIIIREIAEDVYKTLGSGFSEDVYDRAMQVGLRLAKIGYEGQKPIETPGDGAFYPLSILCTILSATITASRNVPAIKQGGFLSPSFPRRAQPVPCSGRPTAVPSLGQRARQRSGQQVDRPL